MTKPEGHYADAATEREAEEKKMRAEFEAAMYSYYNYYSLVLREDGLYKDGFTREAWPLWQAACASKQKEIEA